MIEITIRLKPGHAPHFAHLLRTLADTGSDRGQAKHYRGAARRIEHLTRARQTVRPCPPAPAVRPFRYTPRVRRPRHDGIDERAVQRVVLDIRPLPVLSREEARLACWHLTARGYSAPRIAELLSVAQRTVNRWRAEDRQAVPA